MLFLIFSFLQIADQPEITIHPQSVTKTEGESVTLCCTATGNPEPTMSWTTNGSPIRSNVRISLSDDKTKLTFTNVKRTDSGEYRCVATNSLGNVSSNVATLDVQCEYSIRP